MSEKVKAQAAGAAVMDNEASAGISVAEPECRSGVTDEMIAERAYSYWVARGCQGGSPEDDWYRAQEQLMSEIKK